MKRSIIISAAAALSMIAATSASAMPAWVNLLPDQVQVTYQSGSGNGYFQYQEKIHSDVRGPLQQIQVIYQSGDGNSAGQAQSLIGGRGFGPQQVQLSIQTGDGNYGEQVQVIDNGFGRRPR